MKLFRFGPRDRSGPGWCWPTGPRIDVSGFGQDYDEAFFGGDGLHRLRAWLAQNQRRCPRGRRRRSAGPGGRSGRARSSAWA